jgi:hypothetical protein
LLLGLIKPQFLLMPLLVLAVQRRWRTLGVVVAGAGVLGGAGFVICGNWLPGYLRLLRLLQDPGTTFATLADAETFVDGPATMENWRGLIYALLGTDRSWLAGGLLLLLTMCSGGLACVLVWRAGRRFPAWEIAFAAGILLGLLAIPHLYLHDLVMALLPGMILGLAAGEAARRGAGPAAMRRLHTLRWLLGLGPALLFLAPFWQPPLFALVPWYLVLLIGATLWALPILNRSFDGSDLGTQTDAGAAEPVLQ